MAATKKLEKESKSEKTMWSKAFKKQEEEKNDTQNQSSPQTSPTSRPTKNSNNNNNNNNNNNKKENKNKETEEGEIDLSEFGIGKKKNEHQLTTTSALYFFASFLTVGVISLFAFGRFRNIKWRFF